MTISRYKPHLVTKLQDSEPKTVTRNGVTYQMDTANIGRANIAAIVTQGTLQDAQWASYGVNATHGLRRTNEDKRRAVEAALKHPKAASLTDVQIAKHCGVSSMTVGNYRKTIIKTFNDADTPRTVTRNGVTYQMDTANIGRANIAAIVTQGTLQDAQWASYGVNATHGLRRTNEDKRRAVEAALKHPRAAALSNYQIAAHCGVSEKTIRNYRDLSTEITQIDTTPRTVTRNGVTYQMDTANIGQRTNEIKTLMKRTAQDIIEIGEKLIEVKARLPHGAFGGWLESEFEWSDRTARKYMSIADVFSNRKSSSDLVMSFETMAYLAAPSTPDDARAEAIARAEAGERITHSAFGGWLDSEFGWSDRTARSYMRVAETFKSETISDLNIQARALYLLAAPSTPDDARAEAITRAQAGERITHSAAKAYCEQF